jgi:hypothetical protein
MQETILKIGRQYPSQPVYYTVQKYKSLCRSGIIYVQSAFVKYTVRVHNLLCTKLTLIVTKYFM